MFLIDAIKPKAEKKLKTILLFFARLFRGGESEAYKIKQFFFFALGLLAAKKLYSKETRKHEKNCLPNELSKLAAR